MQCLFCPFWHFSPYWLSMKVLCQSTWCHMLVMHLFLLFIFPCGVFPCPSLSWHGMVIHFARELLAPSWCCALFCLTFLVHMLCRSCTVSTIYWSVVNESDVKQTKSISNRPNPFSDKIGNNKNIHTTCKAALPSRAGTTKHVYKKRDTKQAQHQEGANNSRAKWITNPVIRNSKAYESLAFEILGV